MNLRRRHQSTILLLSLSLLAASSAPDLPRPTFLLKLGEYGTSENQFTGPNGVDFDSAGNMYVAEGSNERIQKFDSSGNFVLMWGWGVDDGSPEFQKCTSSCQKGDDGSFTGQFDEPRGLAVDDAGNVFVCDRGNARVQKFDSNGNFLLMWGWGVDDGTAAFQVCTSGCQKGIAGDGVGQIRSAVGVAVDSTGNVYVSESYYDRVQKFANNGTYLSVLGSSGSGDGQFTAPYGVAVDDSDNIYVSDFGNNRVQKFDSSHTFVTTWGSYGKGDDGFWGPAGVAIGPLGTICVADLYNRRVKEFDEDGEFLQTWGWGVQDGSSRFQVCTENCRQGVTGTGDGQFAVPQYLEFDGNGSLHVPEHSNGHHVQEFGFSSMKFYIADLRTPRPPIR